MKFFLGSLLLIALVFPAANAAPDNNPSISNALHQMYDSQFDVSRGTLSAYSTANPADPLAYSLRAASYLFAALDRGGALKSSLLDEDHRGKESLADHVDPEITAAVNAAATQTREHAEAILAKNPLDRNALLAVCIVSGVQRDYLAMVEHKLRESYPYIKESQDYALRLLQADPTAYDAYLTKGFTEYLVASLPFYLRWPMRLDNLSGTKQQGLDDMQIAAQSGQYLKPFAQLLLAMFYLREKQQGRTEELLAQLAHEFPENQSFRQELRRLEGSRGASN